MTSEKTVPFANRLAVGRSGYNAKAKQIDGWVMTERTEAGKAIGLLDKKLVSIQSIRFSFLCQLILSPFLRSSLVDPLRVSAEPAERRRNGAIHRRNRRNGAIHERRKAERRRNVAIHGRRNVAIHCSRRRNGKAERCHPGKAERCHPWKAERCHPLFMIPRYGSFECPLSNPRSTLRPRGISVGWALALRSR